MLSKNCTAAIFHWISGVRCVCSLRQLRWAVDLSFVAIVCNNLVFGFDKNCSFLKLISFYIEMWVLRVSLKIDDNKKKKKKTKYQLEPSISFVKSTLQSLIFASFALITLRNAVNYHDSSHLTRFIIVCFQVFHEIMVFDSR